MSDKTGQFEEFIYKRTYARWMDTEQRRENWDETVGRYRNYFLERFDLPRKMEDRFNEACDMILQKEIVPSMRCMWTAGKALDESNIAGYNCFSGDTKIMTYDNGTICIQDAVGEAKLLDMNGEWTDSVVKSFGQQRTVEAKFGYSTQNESFRTTLDHEWVLVDGTRLRTTDLVSGDKINFNSYDRKNVYDSIDYRLGLIHGLIYADGTTRYRYKTKNINCVSQRRVKGYVIRLCGDQEDLLPIFKDYNRSYPPSADGDPIVYVMDNFAKTHSLKDLPNADYETEDYLVGFIRGWLAGDGYVSPDGQISLASTVEGMEWINMYAPRLGYLVQSLKTFPSATNYGIRKKTLFNIYFNRKSFTPDDMIIKRKRDRLKPIVNAFTFRGIVPNSEKTEDVFCAIVPNTHTFTLANGMVTGNCTYVLIDTVKSWADMLYLLMNGSGVGYSVERQVIANLPEVPAELIESDEVVVFGDSKRGWAEGLLEYMTKIYSGTLPKYDLSLIRPKGTRLKTFGGKAGGSDDLKMLLDYLKVAFLKARGRRLNSLECHDVACVIANVVVSAGIRRSACISLSNLSDQRMRSCKVGEFWKTHPQRAMCNNSVAYTEKPDMHIWMQEWMALMESGAGERGIFNRESALKQFEKLGRSTVDSEGNEYVIGANPCVSGDTLLLTDEGHFPIRDLVNTEVSVWNGIEFSDVVPFSTGENPIYHVELSNGVSIDCTGYHEWMITDGKSRSNNADRVKTTDLCVGDKLVKYDMPMVDVGEDQDPNEMYSLGFYAGDGNEGYHFSWVYNTKYCCEDRLIGTISADTKYGRKRWVHGIIENKFYVPINTTLQNKLEWFAGLLDSDGCITRNSNSVGAQISSINPKFLRDVRLMLTTLGVQCEVVGGKSENKRMMPDGRGGQKAYLCKADERISLSAHDMAHLIEIGMRCSRLDLDEHAPNRNASRFVTVVDVEELRYSEETFCVTESKNHTATFNGIVTGQCGEIFLRPNQACNLSEVIVRSEDTLKTLLDKVKSATVLGCMQACLTDTKFLGPEWKHNMEEERLLGVSFTGTRDHPVLNKTTQLASVWLSTLRDHAHVVAQECAEVLHINKPAAITCCKPSGTVSALNNTASGIHTRFAPYYIRRVRVASTDVLCKFLMSVGVPHHPEVGQDEATANTFVFEYPIKAPEDAMFDTSAIEQLEYWRMFKTSWCDHNPSVTVSVKDDEWMLVGAWVYENWDIVGGLSFLPKSDHIYQLAPFEAIDENEYNRRVSAMPDIDFDALIGFERDDETTGAQEFACIGGNCEVQ